MGEGEGEGAEVEEEKETVENIAAVETYVNHLTLPKFSHFSVSCL